jgi:hypothetical protein
VGGAHHIGLERRKRIPVAGAYQRLGRQMKNDLRLRRLNQVRQRQRIADIAKLAFAMRFNLGRCVG